VISSRFERTALSATAQVLSAAKEMQAKGIDVVNLSVGEPDFPTPEHIKAAAKAAIDDDFTRYTMTEGIPELRAAVCEKLRRDNGIDYKPNQVIVSTGAKQCIYNACLVLLNRGDRLLIPAPYWVSYPEMARLVDAEPVIVPTREANGFRLTAEDLRPHLPAKALILNGPCNPTGAAYSREEIASIAKTVVEAGGFIIADEVYEKLIFDRLPFTSVASIAPEIKARTLVVNGVSKAYAMTGWRIGYAAGPAEVVNAMNVAQSHSTSNATSICQRAALAALTGPEDEVRRMAAEFQRRRDFIIERLRALPGWTCSVPRGAFYAFPSVRGSLNRRGGERAIHTSIDLAEYLIREAHVATVPGEAFGAEGFIRISYADSMERLRTALDRIAEALGKLRPL
jgi:aspartate/methionine/tyrosine aminotransferase